MMATLKCCDMTQMEFDICDPYTRHMEYLPLKVTLTSSPQLQSRSLRSISPGPLLQTFVVGWQSHLCVRAAMGTSARTLKQFHQRKHAIQRSMSGCVQRLGGVLIPDCFPYIYSSLGTWTMNAAEAMKVFLLRRILEEARGRD